MQLRKWNKSGLFQPDMRIWTDNEHDDSVLLTNALKGLCHKAPRPHDEISHQSQELGAASVSSSATSWSFHCRFISGSVSCHWIWFHLQFPGLSLLEAVGIYKERNNYTFRLLLQKG